MILSNKYLQILISFISLFCGGLIYVLFRSEQLIMFQWFDTLGISSYIQNCRIYVANCQMPYIVKYCLPNALWIISYLFLIDCIINKHNFFWLLFLPTIAIISEFLQLFMIIPGFFDYLDLLCLLFPTILFLTLKCIHYEK